MAQTTKITDFIDSDGYANTFYGTYDHYQRIGWYFDLVVDSLDDLTSEQALKVLTGRFVLVKDEDAIFMRTSNGSLDYYERFVIEKKESADYYKPYSTETIEIDGFRFVAYASRRALLLIGEKGYIDLDKMMAYKVANTKCVRRMSAYYFPTSQNEEIWKDTGETEPELIE